jgi:L-alanine-DL-glutamate epimerase-like enolase superfamily enzyme
VEGNDDWRKAGRPRRALRRRRALDLALWDPAAKIAQLPLYDF